MVCVPCILYGLIPLVVWLWNRFFLPIIRRFRGQEAVKPMEPPSCPVSKKTVANGDVCPVANGVTKRVLTDDEKLHMKN
jgi:hypothetical protein